MRGINIAIIAGHLGADPEVRYMPNGDPVANFRVATTKGWTDKTTGEKKEATEWHNIVLFGGKAKVANDYLHKGSAVHVTGELRTRSWDDKESGQTRYKTEIVGNDMQMLDRKPTNDE